MSAAKIEADMCAELEAWCKAQGLPYLSADELVVEATLTPEQSTFLRDFMKRWDAMLDGEGWAA